MQHQVHPATKAREHTQTTAERSPTKVKPAQSLNPVSDPPCAILARSPAEDSVLARSLCDVFYLCVAALIQISILA
jgi:hypothetical protein